MEWEEAIDFCANHNCKECPAYNAEDCRTQHEKENLHYPCCINLVNPDKRILIE
jgi:hypothetical protein